MWGFLHPVCFSPHRTGSKLDDFSFFHQKKKEKKKRNKLHGIIRVVVVLKLSMRGSDLGGL